MNKPAGQRLSPSVVSDAVEAEKLKFLGIISHELKTPLNAILGFSNLIEDGAPAIWAGQRAMAQALGAILDNAIKFTDKEGLVTLEYSLEENGDLRLLGSDTGCSIQSEKLADENLNRDY